MSAIEEHTDTQYFRWASVWLQIVPFLTSFLLHALMMLVLGLWIIPALQEGLSPAPIEATLTPDHSAEAQQLQATSFEIQSDSRAVATEAAMSTAAESVAPIIETSEAKVRIAVSHRVPAPNVAPLNHLSDQTLMESVPILMAAMPMHQHRGQTRVTEVKGTGQIATTLNGDLKSISQDGDAVVVWMLDQSLSMQMDIKSLAEKMSQTLLDIEKDKTSRMMHYVVAFGDDVRLVHDSTIKSRAVVRSIYNLPPDPSGRENTFQAVAWCVDNLFNSSRWMRGTGKQKLLVLWTDESGDDYLRLEDTIRKCVQSNVRVDVIGPSAVLGAQTGYTSYRHTFDGLDYQLPVHRGPDSAFPQKLSLGYWYRGIPETYNELIRGPWPGSSPGMGGSNLESLLSGFSPYALTRLSRQTGGRYTIYDRPGDRPPFSLEQVRDYMPDYRSFREIMADLNRQPLRQLVLAASAETWNSQWTRYSQPNLWFQNSAGGETPNEFRTGTLMRQLPPALARAAATSAEVERALGVFARAAASPAFIPRAEDDPLRSRTTDESTPEARGDPETSQGDMNAPGAQDTMAAEQPVAVDETLLEQLYKNEKSKRWRAWCDLNLGRLLAVSVRLREFTIAGTALLNNPGGLQPNTNSVHLRPGRSLRGGPVAEQRRAIAIRVLQRCVDDNPNTPWAVMAERELRDGFGFEYRERYMPRRNNVPTQPPAPAVPVPNL